MSAIKQVDINNTVYDLDSRSITLTSTSGTLTNEQFAILQSSSNNYVIYNNKKYGLVYQNSTYMYYNRTDANGKIVEHFQITIASKAYSYKSINIATTDTTNTAGSSNDTDKLYIIGAKSQDSTGVQTYSNSNVYEQAGTLYANQLTVANGPTNNMDVATKQYVDNAIGDAIMASY